MNTALFINYIYPDHRGGTGKYVRDLAAVLAEKAAVTVFCCTHDPDRAGISREEGVTVHRVLIGRGDLGLLRRGNRRKYYRYVEPFLAEYDVLNIQGVGLLPLHAVRKYRHKAVFTVHASLKKETAFDMSSGGWRILLSPLRFLRDAATLLCAGYLERRTLRMVPRIIVMSGFVRDYISAMYPGSVKDKISVIPIGIYPERFPLEGTKEALRARLELPRTGTLFVTLRRLVPRMGLSNLIEAFRNVCRADPGRDIFLTIGGSGPLREALQRQIDDAGLTGRIRLYGFVPDGDMAAFYQAADCFILPTEALEGFGIVTIEALTNNLPVIGTDAGATPEILEHFQQDLITRGFDAAALAEKITYFLDSQPEGVCRNREKAVRRYDWRHIAGRYLRIYEDLAGDG